MPTADDKLDNIYRELRSIHGELKTMNGRLRTGEIERARLTERVDEHNRLFERMDRWIRENENVIMDMRINQAKLMLVNGLSGGFAAIVIYLILQVAGIHIP